MSPASMRERLEQERYPGIRQMSIRVNIVSPAVMRTDTFTRITGKGETGTAEAVASAVIRLSK